MNRLVFNPNIDVIEQWSSIYICSKEVNKFQNIIDQTYMYLDVISNNKLLKSKYSQDNQDSLNNKEIKRQEETKEEKKKKDFVFQEQNVQECIAEIKKLKNKFQEEYEEIYKASISKKEFDQQRIESNSPFNQMKETFENLIFSGKLEIIEKHLQQLKKQAIVFYDQFLKEENQIVDKFVRYKMCQIESKYNKLVTLFQQLQTLIGEKQQIAEKIRIIFDNVFIETEYLHKLVNKNKSILLQPTHQKQFSNGDTILSQIRQRQLNKMNEHEEDIQSMKFKMKQLYFFYLQKKKAKIIKDHQKLQKIIIDQIAVNADEYQQSNGLFTFFNGFIVALLLIALISIIIFRGINLSSLESHQQYQKDFKIWRGASYLIYFNWIIGIVIFFFQKFKINYKLILLQKNTFIPKYQSFFWTASILSAVYLIIFFIYLLGELNYIVDYPSLKKSGYYVWIINIIFLLNPFKIINYNGRKYFLVLFWNFIISIFRPMTVNLVFLSVIIGSFVQPFSDFAFTICQAVYLQQRNCKEETSIATFVFTIIFIFYRAVQNLRLHKQFGDKFFSRPMLGFIAAVCGLNTVISSYVYNVTNKENAFIYWIVAASISTLAGINAEVRADWGIISFDQTDCLVRKYKRFSRPIYLIAIVINVVLSIAWVLTISNNSSANFGIDPLYFFMTLTVVELARKGMWAFFRIEDDHCTNMGNLQAIKDDSSIIEEIESELRERKNKQSQIINSSTQLIQNETKQTNIAIIYSCESMNKETLQQCEKKLPCCKPKSKLNRQQKLQKEDNSREISAMRINICCNGIQPTDITLQDLQNLVIRKKQQRQLVCSFLSELKSYLKLIHQMYVTLNWEDQY